MLSKGCKDLSLNDCLSSGYWSKMLMEYDFHMIGQMVRGIEARYAENGRLYFDSGTQFCSINDIVSWYNSDEKCWQ